MSLAVAGDPSTPAEVLTALGNSFDEDVLRAVVRNPNAPLDVLVALGEKFPREFLANPVFQVLMITEPEFVQRIPHTLWMKLLRCEELPEAWVRLLQTVYGVEIPKLQREMEQHVSVAGEVKDVGEIQGIFEQMDPRDFAFEMGADVGVLLTILFPEQMYRRLQRGTVNMLEKLEGTTPYSLAIISHMARHVRNAPEAMRWLMLDKRFPVRYALAQNPVLPPEIIDQLVRDDYRQIRVQMALHPLISEKHVEQLWRDDALVLAAMLQHRKLDEQYYINAVRDKRPLLRVALARSAYAPQKYITQLVRDADVTVRKSVAMNPRLLANEFEILARDAEKNVRFSLASNSALPPRIAKQFLGLRDTNITNAMCKLN